MAEQKITPTGALMTAMEEFSRSEPTAAIIVWRDESNDFHSIYTASGPESIGMMEMAKHMILRNCFKVAE